MITISAFKRTLVAISGSIKLVLDDKTKSKRISDLKNLDKQINEVINNIQ